MLILKKKSQSKGFTFTEVVLSVGMVTIVGIAIYSSLKSGIDIWRKAYILRAEEDLGLLCEKLSSDANNSIPFQNLNFEGEVQELKFPTLVSSPQGFRSVGEVKYMFSPYEKVLKRGERDYSAIYSQKIFSFKTVLKNVEYLGFSYYFWDSEAKEYAWSEEWIKNSFPLAVRLEIRIKDGQYKRTLIRTFSFPQAQEK